MTEESPLNVALDEATLSEMYIWANAGEMLVGSPPVI